MDGILKHCNWSLLTNASLGTRSKLLHWTWAFTHHTIISWYFPVTPWLCYLCRRKINGFRCKLHPGEARMLQRWGCLPPTTEVQDQFWPGAICKLSLWVVLALLGGFLQVLRYVQDQMLMRFKFLMISITKCPHW